MKKPIPTSAKTALRFGLGILGAPLFIAMGLALFAALIFLCVFLESLLFSPPEPFFPETIGSYERTASAHWTMFQDYFDYEKYIYREADFTDNPYFTRVTQDDMDAVQHYTEGFGQWISEYRDSEKNDERTLYENYDFDPDCISSDDYVYLKKIKKGDKIEFYYFDSESMTLYFFADKF